MTTTNISECDMTVTSKAMRPGSHELQCFYCKKPIGSEHKTDCVLIERKVKVRMTIEYEIEVPASWDKSQIEFHRNDSSWCASNAIDEIRKLTEEDCLCSKTKFEYLEDVGEKFLSEG